MKIKNLCLIAFAGLFIANGVTNASGLSGSELADNSPPYKVIFMGSHEFSCPSLQVLLDNPVYSVQKVYVHPYVHKLHGHQVSRENVPQQNPVYQMAQERRVPVAFPETLDTEIAALRELSPDVIVVVAYGAPLPQAILDLPPHGCINVHASLLPRWRGVAPILRCMQAGDQQTGISLIRMTDNVDAGGILAQVAHPVAPKISSPELRQQLAQLGAQTLDLVLPCYLRGEVVLMPQNESLATEARRLDEGETLLDPNQSAQELERCVRAFQPWFHARVSWRGTILKVLEAEVIQGLKPLAPGTWYDDDLIMACGTDALRLLHIKFSDEKL